jgi:hypothetical protein
LKANHNKKLDAAKAVSAVVNIIKEQFESKSQLYASRRQQSGRCGKYHQRTI